MPFSVEIYPANCTFDSAVTIRFDADPGLSSNGDDWYLDGINLTRINASVDTTTPNITLIAPQNNTVSTTGNITFTSNATENVQLLNATLYHNITGIWEANASVNLSGILNTTSFTINNIKNTNFKWNVLYCDNSSNCAFAQQNNTLTVNITIPDTTPPTSNTPLDATYIINSTATIDWILQDNQAPGQYIVEREGIQVNNSNWLNNTNLAISVNTTTAGFWNYTISFNDSVGNEGTLDTVFINITDNTTNTQPTVTHNNPLNNSLVTTNATLLEATIYDKDLDNLTVWFYGDEQLLNTSVNQTNNTKITHNWTSLAEGIHNWTVIVNDGTENSTNVYEYFNVTYPKENSSSGNGGSQSSGSSGGGTSPGIGDSGSGAFKKLEKKKKKQQDQGTPAPKVVAPSPLTGRAIGTTEKSFKDNI